MAWSEKEIIAALSPLLLAYGSALDSDRFTFYVKQLRNIPPYILTLTVQKIINTRTFLPAIAEIRKQASSYQRMADHSVPPDWSIAWQEVVREVHRVGHCGHPKIIDKYAQEAVKRIGWQNICLAPSRDGQILRAQFRDTYLLIVAQDTDRKESVEALRQLMTNESHSEIGGKMKLLLNRIDLKS